MRKIDEKTQIDFWVHMLDESMNEKGIKESRTTAVGAVDGVMPSAMKKWPDGYLFEPNPADTAAYNKEIEELGEIVVMDKDIYNMFVPDDDIDIDGTQRDVDDFDVYRINLTDTIGEEEFYDSLFDKLEEKYGSDPVVVPLKDLADSIHEFSEQIADKALENYEPSDDSLVHRGRMHWGGYYPG